MLLENKVAIVSGIGPGMGRDISLLFARHGADLAIAARTPEKLDAVAAEVEALGRKVIKVPTDVTRREDCERLVEETRKAFGHIDVLVNNAFHAGYMQPFETSQVEKWRDAFEVNLIGTLQLTQSVVPVMKEQAGGSIVMINSQVIREVMHGMGDYAASKGALMAATQTLARELGGYGIRVNSVVPGYIWGPSVEAYFAWQARERGVEPQVVYEEVASRIALGRVPTSAEIAGSVLFLASDLASVVTGQALDVNGGEYFH
jgi:NAD(P)-dependent dehydrogenase (short-subunit alcohol dehydrogenase family)